MQESKKQYSVFSTINLLKGLNFANTQSYYQKIHKRFCLLSWLVSSLEINIERQITDENWERFELLNSRIKVFTVKNPLEEGQKKKLRYMMYQENCKEKKNHEIKYIFEIMKSEKEKIGQKDVQDFLQNESSHALVEFIKNDKSIDINIKIEKKKTQDPFLDTLTNQKMKDYLKEKREITNNHIKQSAFNYYYIEPQENRNKKQDKKHLNLAFQGGGAKGVSYVGAYESILEFQQQEKQLYRKSKNKNKNKEEEEEEEEDGGFPIKSVIGSSAGGILAFAISAKIDPKELRNLCMMMDTLTSDATFKSREQAQSVQEDFFSKQLQAIKSLLISKGVIQKKYADVIEKMLTVDDKHQQFKVVENKLLNLLQKINPSIANLLTFECKEEQIEVGCCKCFSSCCQCCSKKDTVTKRLNYYGLVYCALMTGKAVEDILAFCFVLMIVNSNGDSELMDKFVKIFQNQKFRQSGFQGKSFDYIYQKAQEMKKETYNLLQKSDFKKLPQSQILSAVKKFTMKQYYFLNAVQFTVTSVDIDDKILRFFNHKTTPDLPVCKAVQMTGSFPVVFQSLKWQKNWGSYFIHYKEELRELDLTGHNFTDGGLIANFPLKFLDNQRFRPMYFSHQKQKPKNNQEKTLLFGFGLDQLSEFPENKMEEIDFDDIKDSLKKAVPKWSALWRVLYCCSTMSMCQNVEQDNEPIELFNFLYKLVDALRFAEQNLNFEAFQKSSIITKLHQLEMKKDQISKIIQNQPRQNNDQSNYNKSLSDSGDSINQKEQTLLNKNQPNFGKQLYSLIEFQNCYGFANPQEIFQITYLLKNKINKIDGLDQKQIQDLQKQVQSFNYDKVFKQTHLKEPKTSPIYHLLIQIKNCQTIKSLSEDNMLVYDLIQKLYSKRAGQFQQKSSDPSFSVSKYIHTQNDFVEKMSNENMSIKQIIKIQKYVDNLIKDKNPLLRDVYAKAKIMRNTQSIKKNISQVLRRAIRKNNQKYKIHLFLEANYYSHIFYPDYFEMLQKTMHQYKKTDIKIDMITCTDYHAIFGLLYCLAKNGKKKNDLDQQKFAWIRKELSIIRSQFIKCQDLESNYRDSNWIKNNLRIYQEKIEEKIKEKSEDQVKNIKERYQKIFSENDQDYLIKKQLFQKKEGYDKTLIEIMLNRILSHFKELTLIKDQNIKKERIDKILDKLSQESFGNLMETSKKARQIFDNAQKYFGELIYTVSEYVVFSSDFIDDETSFSKEDVFKGIVIGKLIQSKNYQKKIKDLINEEFNGQLNPQKLTLKQFYNNCQTQKVILNFSTVDITSKKVVFINQHNRPNMLLVNSLLAAASLPYLSSGTSVQKKQNKRESKRIIATAMKYFDKDQVIQQSENSHYITGNFISSKPLEILTNERFRKVELGIKNEDQQNIIQMNFLFNQLEQKKDQTGQNSESQIQQRKKKENLLSRVFKKYDKQKRNYPCWPVYKYVVCPLLKSCMFGCWSKDQQCCCCIPASSCCCFSECCFGLSQFKISTQLEQFFKGSKIGKYLNLRIESNDNLVTNLYYQKLSKLPLRIGTLDFYKINKTRPDLEDTIRQARCILSEVNSRSFIVSLSYLNLQDKGQYNPRVWVEFSLAHHKPERTFKDKDEDYKKAKPQDFYRLKFISLTKWGQVQSRYLIANTKLLQGNQKPPKGYCTQHSFDKIQEDYIDFAVGQNKANFSTILRFSFVNKGQEKTIIKTFYQVNFGNMKKILEYYQKTRDEKEKSFRVVFNFQYRQTEPRIKFQDKPIVQDKKDEIIKQVLRQNFINVKYLEPSSP